MEENMDTPEIKKEKRMEREDDIYERLADPEVLGGGGNMEFVDCFFCKYSDAETCKKLNCKKLVAPVDLFNCPYLEKKDSAQEAIGGIFGFKKK